MYHFYCYSLYTSPIIIALFQITVQISEFEFGTVVALLSPDDLPTLYDELQIPDNVVKNAERSANTSDTVVRAKAVLRKWRELNGMRATRKAILKALRAGVLNLAADELERQWNSEGKIAFMKEVCGGGVL